MSKVVLDSKKLFELVDENRPITYGVVQPGKEIKGGVYFVRSGDIKQGKIDKAVLRTISVEISKQYDRTLLRGGELLISLVGNPGEVALVEDALIGANIARQVGLIAVDPKKASSRYLYYFMRSKIGRDKIFANSLGSVQQVINLKELRNIDIPLPSPKEQERISEILGGLDDKISINQSSVATLEAMARALFKSWFVDFDPVRAKAADKKTGLPKEIEKLFPNKLVKSELGEVPEGWRVGTVDDFAEVVYGAPFSSGQFNTDGKGLPIARIRDLPTENSSLWTEEVHPKGYLICPGDIVVGMDGEFRAYLWGGQKTWMNQRICCFRPKEGVSVAFLKESIARPLAEVEASETATTVIHLGKGDIDRFKLFFPSQGP